MAMFVGAPLAVLAIRRQPDQPQEPEPTLSLEDEARKQVARAIAVCDLENCLDPYRRYVTGPSLWWRLKRKIIK